MALGGLIEIFQGYTSSRSQEWADFYADIVGVILGFFAYQLIVRVRRQYAERKSPTTLQAFGKPALMGLWVFGLMGL